MKAARYKDRETASLPIDIGAIAEETDLFEEIYVVTATKQERKAIDSPFTVFVLTREEIQALCPTDIGDLLYAIPGLDVFRRTDRVYAAAPAGLASDLSNQHLVLVDDIAYPTKRGGGADWSNLPVQVDEIERIEFLPGPQTVLYGAAAASGVIHIITRNASPETWNKDYNSSFRVRMGTKRLGKYEFTLHNKYESDTLTVWGSSRSCEGFQTPTDFNGNELHAYDDKENSRFLSGGLGWRHSLDDHRTLRFTFSRYSGHHDPSFPVINETINQDQRNTNLNLVFTDKQSRDREFTLLLKYNDMFSDFRPSPLNTFGITDDKDQFTDSQVEIRQTFKNRSGHRYLFGARFESFSTKGAFYSRGRHVLDESSINTLVEIPADLKNSWFLGLDYYDSSRAGQELTWKLFCRHTFKTNEVLRFGYSTSVRGPDLVALEFTELNVGPFRLVEGNEDLKPERFEMAELGYERLWRRSALKANIFRGSGRRLIRTVDGGVFIPPLGQNNIELINEPRELRLAGLTLSYSHKWARKWTGRLGYRYLVSEWDDGRDRYMSPENYASFNMTYRPDMRISLNLFGRCSSSYSNASYGADSSKLSGYTIFDFALKSFIGKGRDKEIWLKVNNLADDRHHEIFPLVQAGEPPGYEIGRTAVIGCSVRF